MLAQLRFAADADLADAGDKLPAPDAPTSEIIQRGLEMLANTAPFDCTHHPAMSIPCGMVDGLPVGAMLIGKMYDEETIYRAAGAFENRRRLEITESRRL